MQNIKRIIVTKSAAHNSKTKKIIDNATRLLNIKETLFLTSEQPKFPANFDKKQQLEYMKETLVITTRKATPFVTTFASPGKIVEDLGSILTLGWHCSYNCSFCYLLGSMFQRKWQEVYVNIDDLEKQISYEEYVHRSILTIWSLLSKYHNQTILKIPPELKSTADWLRKRYIAKKINSDSKSIEFLSNNFKYIFETKLKIDDFEVSLKQKIQKYYKLNRKFLPWLNVSEYTDFLAIDPLTEFSSDLNRILKKHNNIQINIRTKSSNVDGILKYPAKKNVKIAINFNTEYAINNFEVGAVSLDERIKAAKKIQNTKGFLLKIVIEPIIIYQNYEHDYLNLVDRLKKEINLSAVEDFTFGTVRFKTKLVKLVDTVYPNNNLNLNDKNLIKFPKDRIRYEESIRADLYSKIKSRLSSTGLVVRLAAETPEMWDRVGISKEKHIAKSVNQI